MVYNMVMFVDGGCRGNGYQGAFGACACYVVKKWGQNETFTQWLPGSMRPVPTNQRAELSAIILALEHAIEERGNLHGNPYMKVTIHTDSKYAHGCMTEWYRKWQNNGFTNALGNEVTNRDLIERALELECDILDRGNVIWEWIPRSDNTVADEAVNEEMDKMDG
ncbi:MAG: hypothetical protein Q9161_008472 [Pseudevernia consocians]